MIDKAGQRQMFGASVQAEGASVVLEAAGATVTMTPRQAQRFAYYLAHAYTTAGGLERNRAGNLRLSSTAR